MTPFLPRLHAAIAEATPGPWMVLKHYKPAEEGGEWDGAWFLYGKVDGQHGVRFMYADGDQFDVLPEATISLILLLVNAAPKMKAALEAAKAVSYAFRNQDQDSPGTPLHTLRAALAALDEAPEDQQ